MQVLSSIMLAQKRHDSTLQTVARCSGYTILSMHDKSALSMHAHAASRLLRPVATVQWPCPLVASAVKALHIQICILATCTQ